MADKQEVELVITPDGLVTFQAKGKTDACPIVAKMMEQSLGPVIKREHSHLFYEHGHDDEHGQAKTGG